MFNPEVLKCTRDIVERLCLPSLISRFFLGAIEAIAQPDKIRMQRVDGFGKKVKIVVRKPNSLPLKFSLGNPIEWGDAWLTYGLTENKQLSWCQLHWTWWWQLHWKFSSVPAPEIVLQIKTFNAARRSRQYDNISNSVIVITDGYQWQNYWRHSNSELPGFIVNVALPVLDGLFCTYMQIHVCTTILCFQYHWTWYCKTWGHQDPRQLSQNILVAALQDQQ